MRDGAWQRKPCFLLSLRYAQHGRLREKSMQHLSLTWYSTPRAALMRLGLLLALIAALLPIGAAHVALAAPTVRYDAFNNIIYVGSDYSPSDPAQAPFVGYPSHPQAPKSPITIPEVAAALNNPALLQNQGGGA